MTTIYAVSYNYADYESNYNHLIGVALSPEAAEKIRAAYVDLLLSARNKNRTYCKACGFEKNWHNPKHELHRQMVVLGKTDQRYAHLLTCRYVPPDPLTALEDREEVTVEEWEADALPTET